MPRVIAVFLLLMTEKRHILLLILFTESMSMISHLFKAKKRIIISRSGDFTVGHFCYLLKESTATLFTPQHERFFGHTLIHFDPH